MTTKIIATTISMAIAVTCLVEVKTSNATDGFLTSIEQSQASGKPVLVYVYDSI